MQPTLAVATMSARTITVALTPSANPGGATLRGTRVGVCYELDHPAAPRILAHARTYDPDRAVHAPSRASS